MADKTEMIRHEMEETRSSLAEKLELLQDQVVGTVHDTTTAVTETVDTVKEAVQDTVEAVKETVHDTVKTVKRQLNLRRQVERHPWPMFGASVAVGFLIQGLLGGRRRPQATPRTPEASGSNGASTARPSPFYEPAPTPSAPPKRGLIAIELEKLKNIAIGTALGVVREIIEDVAPGDLKQKLAGVVDDLNDKLGGEKIRGPILRPARPVGAATEAHARETAAAARS